MKDFIQVPFDPGECRKQILEFQQWLRSCPVLDEAKDLLPFFRSHLHLSAYLGSYHSDMVRFNRVAFEYDLFGDFTCDIVVSDTECRAYAFIELEDASPNSIFVMKKGKNTPEWSSRFEHGYSQVIDWFYKLNDLERTDDFRARFGSGPIDYVGMLLVGRNADLSDREARRLAWRERQAVVNSRRIFCLPFDRLCEQLLWRLEKYPTTLKAAAGPGSRDTGSSV